MLMPMEVPASTLPTRKRPGPDMEPANAKRTRLDQSPERPTKRVATAKGADTEESGSSEREYAEENMDDRLLEYKVSEEETPDTAHGEGIVGGAQNASAPDAIEQTPHGWVRLPVAELIIRDAWMNWEQDLRRAYRQFLLAQAMVSVEVPGSEVEVQELNVDEEEHFGIWRSRYLNQPAGFEEERMEAGAFGLGE